MKQLPIKTEEKKALVPENIPEQKEQIIKLKNANLDMEMHVLKNAGGVYFVTFRLYGITAQGNRYAKTNNGPIYPFNSIAEIGKKFSKLIRGAEKEITI